MESATCEIKPGDQIALMGPSGSGKSTLLQVLGGLESPTKGTISWPILGEKDFLRPYHISFIFQMPSLVAPLSVVENVELPLLLMNTDTKSARTEAMNALEQLNMHYLAHKLPEELSGGQAQRVAVARALAGKPQLILADEPIGQLDHPTANFMMDTLFASLNETGAAIVVATHDPEIAQRFDMKWHMYRGRLEVEGA
ncbi:ATP-binding cassette domain-containing protein [Aneurinibacillus sp. Ricciae_BoGa-3]|uniref:ABC transporter ATP-binding protein n=1 Tax=Aneurinibacillus sp. Ricciae_BoGa-3 TaxID=3022697 RepID=UPI0023407DF1|nr:ATP-binding cassette domain-containing protein [Aneurinibacillus sp. Ricciae_BoGa-3]WCK52550.1 ATP-binding cassette domain-containing protein [Aneurinibacillus sp. Ricciae_BoGa-3]